MSPLDSTIIQNSFMSNSYGDSVVLLTNGIDGEIVNITLIENSISHCQQSSIIWNSSINGNTFENTAIVNGYFGDVAATMDSINISTTMTFMDNKFINYYNDISDMFIFETNIDTSIHDITVDLDDNQCSNICVSNVFTINGPIFMTYENTNSNEINNLTYQNSFIHADVPQYIHLNTAPFDHLENILTVYRTIGAQEQQLPASMTIDIDTRLNNRNSNDNNNNDSYSGIDLNNTLPTDYINFRNSTFDTLADNEMQNKSNFIVDNRIFQSFTQSSALYLVDLPDNSSNPSNNTFIHCQFISNNFNDENQSRLVVDNSQFINSVATNEMIRFITNDHEENSYTTFQRFVCSVVITSTQFRNVTVPYLINQVSITPERVETIVTIDNLILDDLVNKLCIIEND